MRTFEELTRNITHQLSWRQDGRLIMTGTLNDSFHDIWLEVAVNGESLVIEEARVEFRKNPSPLCPVVAGRMQRLIGVAIEAGLTRKLFEIFGGEEGCSNLRNLLLGLLPLAVNFKFAKGITNEQEMHDSVGKQLEGTCVGYPKKQEN